MIQLLTCPFCGNWADFKRGSCDQDSWVVECQVCFATSSEESSKEAAAGKWNVRKYVKEEPTPASGSTVKLSEQCRNYRRLLKSAVRILEKSDGTATSLTIAVAEFLQKEFENELAEAPK